jgi:hypothetical protein
MPTSRAQSLRTLNLIRAVEGSAYFSRCPYKIEERPLSILYNLSIYTWIIYAVYLLIHGKLLQSSHRHRATCLNQTGPLAPALRLTSTRRAAGQVWLTIVVIKYLPAAESVNSVPKCFPLEKTPTAPWSMNFSA